MMMESTMFQDHGCRNGGKEKFLMLHLKLNLDRQQLLLVHEGFWLFLYKDVTYVKSNDPPRKLSMRPLKQILRECHEELFSGKSMPLSIDYTYFLVPSSWISKWRNYINQPRTSSQKF